MRVVIFTEGGKNIGFGHMTRCLALCQAFEERGAVVDIILKGDADPANIFEKRACIRFDWLKDREQAYGHVERSDVVIVDSYFADTGFYGTISGYDVTPIYFDDYKRLEYPRGMVLNGAPGADKMRYPARKNGSDLLGERYVVLRKEFWEVPEKDIREDVGSVMVTFGGDDPQGMTPKVKGLLEGSYPDLERHVISGRTMKASEMKEEMARTDIAISAGGQTLYELVRSGVPTIAVCTADNQMPNIMGLERAGCIVYAGRYDDRGIIDRIGVLLRKLLDRDERIKLSSAGGNVIDGRGARRVAEMVYSAKR